MERPATLRERLALLYERMSAEELARRLEFYRRQRGQGPQPPSSNRAGGRPA